MYEVLIFVNPTRSRVTWPDLENASVCICDPTEDLKVRIREINSIPEFMTFIHVTLDSVRHKDG